MFKGLFLQDICSCLSVAFCCLVGYPARILFSGGCCFFFPPVSLSYTQIDSFACLLSLQKNDAFFLWFKYERGFFAQLLRMATQVLRQILVGFASE